MLRYAYAGTFSLSTLGVYNYFLLPCAVLTQEHVIGVHTANLHCNYADRIHVGISHLNGLPVDIAIPPAATAISSPLNVNNWKRLLVDHPNRPLVDYFINGIAEGFLIGNPNHYSLQTET